jgi:hypothetical protein
LLGAEVAETVADPSQIDGELRYLRRGVEQQAMTGTYISNQRNFEW